MNHIKLSKITLFSLIIFCFITLSCGSKEKDKVELKTENDKLSYCIGVNFAKQVKQSFDQSNLDVDPDIFIYAIKDIFADRSLMLNENEIMETLNNLQSEMQAKRETVLTDNLASAKAFLTENAKKPGIHSLPSGLQYEVIKEGTGAIPEATDMVRVHYSGSLLDGTEFDNSYNRGEPSVFTVNKILPGWTQALQLMKTGAHWKVFIPPELAYGENPTSPNIPPNALLIFEIELLEIIE